MPDFPLVDTHLHVWDPGLLRYPWLDDIPLLNKPYLLEDYDRACGAVAVERMVFLQAEVDPAQFQDEADWVDSLADQDSRLQGIVAWAPLEKGDAARPALERLAANPRSRASGASSRPSRTSAFACARISSRECGCCPNSA